jgi:hypothetical protein
VKRFKGELIERAATVALGVITTALLLVVSLTVSALVVL